MVKGKCSVCKDENKVVVCASCKQQGHAICCSCLYQQIAQKVHTPTPQESFACPASKCKGKFSLRTIKEVLKRYSDGLALFSILEEAEARSAFILQKTPQEVLL